MSEQSLPARNTLALLDNLFFSAKINAAAAPAGYHVAYAKTAEQALSLARSLSPALILLDLDANACGPFAFLAELKADPHLQIVPTVGFVSHVNLATQERARAMGCDRIMARSAFDRNLPTLFSELS